MNPFIGEIRIFTGTFAPQGWALCNGQLVPIAQQRNLYSVLGTTYGGDGKSTFALPNLQGAAPLQAGQGKGLSNRPLGVPGGRQEVLLAPTEMALHTHKVNASSSDGTADSPDNGVWATSPFQRGKQSLYSTKGPIAMNAKATAVTGGPPLAHNNMMPYLPLTFIIAFEGVLPHRP